MQEKEYYQSKYFYINLYVLCCVVWVFNCFLLKQRNIIDNYYSRILTLKDISFDILTAVKRQHFLFIILISVLDQY